MAYDVGYKVDFRSGGDTVSEAFSKHISEFVRVYGILNELKENDLTPQEIAQLKYGTINGSRITGTLAGNVDGSHITGKIDGGQLTGEVEAGLVRGELTNATIDSGKVNRLEAFVKEVIDGYGGENYGITESQLGAKGYVKFGNGLMLQWGEEWTTVHGGGEVYTVTFSKEFPLTCFNVMLCGSTSVTVDGDISTTGFNVGIPNNCRIYYLAIGM